MTQAGLFFNSLQFQSEYYFEFYLRFCLAALVNNSLTLA